MVKIRDGVGSDGVGWLQEMVSRKMGDGVDTLFWYDRWLGEVPLCQRFSRKFDLAENKLHSVATMFSLGWEERVWRGSGGGCGRGRKSC